MVTFQLEPGKPPRTFRFGVKAAHALEQAGGANPMMLAARGQTLTAAVLMLRFGLMHEDESMTVARAEKLIDRYLQGGGAIGPLIDALVKAMNESGVYGFPDQGQPGDDEDGDEDRPTTTETKPAEAASE